jgi:hypothetical protein
LQWRTANFAGSRKRENERIRACHWRLFRLTCAAAARDAEQARLNPMAWNRLRINRIAAIEIT